MSIVSLNPFRAIDFFDAHSYDPFLYHRPQKFYEKTESGFKVTLDIPGMDPNSVRVAVKGKVLTINNTDNTMFKYYTLPCELNSETSYSEYGHDRLTIYLERKEKVDAEAVPIPMKFLE